MALCEKDHLLTSYLFKINLDLDKVKVRCAVSDAKKFFAFYWTKQISSPRAIHNLVMK